MYYSFIMMKPDAVRLGLTEKIISRFTTAGLSIAHVGCVTATPELIRAHYAEPIIKYGENFRINAERYFTGKVVLPILLCAEREDIVPFVRKLVGATDPSKAEKGTIRGDFGIDSLAKANTQNRICENLIHASDSNQAVRTEASIWFSKETCSQYFS